MLRSAGPPSVRVNEESGIYIDANTTSQGSSSEIVLFIENCHSQTPSVPSQRNRPQMPLGESLVSLAAPRHSPLPLSRAANASLDLDCCPSIGELLPDVLRFFLGNTSLMGLGALSTKSLASFKPKLVTSRTALITLILLAPTSFSTTLNSVFSSAGAAPAAAPAPPPAIITGAAAAAETPRRS